MTSSLVWLHEDVSVWWKESLIFSMTLTLSLVNHFMSSWNTISRQWCAGWRGITQPPWFPMMHIIIYSNNTQAAAVRAREPGNKSRAHCYCGINNGLYTLYIKHNPYTITNHCVRHQWGRVYGLLPWLQQCSLANVTQPRLINDKISKNSPTRKYNCDKELMKLMKVN